MASAPKMSLSLIPKTGTSLDPDTTTYQAVLPAHVTWELAPQNTPAQARWGITTVEPGALVATCLTGNNFLGQGKGARGREKERL